MIFGLLIFVFSNPSLPFFAVMTSKPFKLKSSAVFSRSTALSSITNIFITQQLYEANHFFIMTILNWKHDITPVINRQVERTGITTYKLQLWMLLRHIGPCHFSSSTRSPSAYLYLRVFLRLEGHNANLPKSIVLSLFQLRRIEVEHKAPFHTKLISLFCSFKRKWTELLGRFLKSYTHKGKAIKAMSWA